MKSLDQKPPQTPSIPTTNEDIEGLREELLSIIQQVEKQQYKKFSVIETEMQNLVRRDRSEELENIDAIGKQMKYLQMLIKDEQEKTDSFFKNLMELESYSGSIGALDEAKRVLLTNQQLLYRINSFMEEQSYKWYQLVGLMRQAER